METRIERRTLKHTFTNDELLSLSEDMAVKNQELRQQEDEKKSVLSQYSSHINELKESINSLATKVANKFEHRDIECEVQFHIPEKDIKTITRLDNGHSFTEKMTDFDYDLFNQFEDGGSNGSMVFESKMNQEEGGAEQGADGDLDQAEYESRMEGEVEGADQGPKKKGGRSKKKGTLADIIEPAKETF